MKLLCDVCELNVASLVCCADEAALCSACDSRVHAANKLASKHQRVPLLSDTVEPAPCDICQEQSSFFFCVEDRAMLCRECDISIHSANALAAKHRRFLLTGIKVSMTSTSGPSQEVTSSESPSLLQQASPPVLSNDLLDAKPQKQSSDSIPFIENVGSKSSISPPQKPSKADIMLPKHASRSSSYVITKDGTLSTSSSVLNSARGKATAASSNNGNATTISIQRLSTGAVPFVAPVLSSFRVAARTQGDVDSSKIHSVDKNISKDNRNNSNNNSLHISVKNSSNDGNWKDNYSNNNSSSYIMDLDVSSPKASVSDYLTAGVPGWKLDELLTDLVGVCESGRSMQPPKENITLGFGHGNQDHPWFAELDFLEEPDQLSSSQEEGVALVPEMPSPPTASGLVTTRAKPTLPWTYDYLFNGQDDVSVVPDIGGNRNSPTSPVRIGSKKRKYWVDIGSDA